MYTVIMKKISFIRFLSYIAASLIIVFITYTIFGKIALFIKGQKIINSQNIRILLNDTYVKSMFNSYGKRILEILADISVKIKVLEKVLSSIEITLMCVAGVDRKSVV